MNRQIATLLAAFCLLAVGCRVFYSSVITLTDVRNSAMKELAQLNKQGFVTAEMDAKIGEADLRYRQAAHAAELALVAYQNGGSPDTYYNALEAVRSAVGALLDLLRPIGSADRVTVLENNLKEADKL